MLRHRFSVAPRYARVVALPYPLRRAWRVIRAGLKAFCSCRAYTVGVVVHCPREDWQLVGLPALSWRLQFGRVTSLGSCFDCGGVVFAGCHACPSPHSRPIWRLEFVVLSDSPCPLTATGLALSLLERISALTFLASKLLLSAAALKNSLFV